MNVNWLKDTQGNSTERLRFFFENYVHHSFKVMKDELYSVRIRISREWLRYVGESIWHDSQQIQKLMDGGIEIGFRVAGLDEIRQWVMGMGPEARVIKPPELVVDPIPLLSGFLGWISNRNEVVSQILDRSVWVQCLHHTIRQR
jgi:hypothetical protein